MYALPVHFAALVHLDPPVRLDSMSGTGPSWGLPGRVSRSRRLRASASGCARAPTGKILGQKILELPVDKEIPRVELLEPETPAIR